jgi:hypothetical protein
MTGRTHPREHQEGRQGGPAPEPCSSPCQDNERHASKQSGRAPEQKPGSTTQQQDLSTWAAELAATLLPLTESQAAAVGRIATHLDARMDHEQAA